MTNTAKILAFDGALGPLSIALGERDRCIVRVAQGNDALERGLPLLDEILREAKIALTGLDAIVCTAGPGAFTGLRITLAMAKGLAFAAGLPLIQISSYDAVREMLVTPPGNSRLLIALRPRAGILSLCIQDKAGTVIGTANGPVTEALQALGPALDGITHVAAWPPVEAGRELREAGNTCAVLPLRSETPAEAALRLARRMRAADLPKPEAVHAVLADYGEQPATTVAPHESHVEPT